MWPLFATNCHALLFRFVVLSLYRLLRNPSPLDEYSQLKKTMFEDILHIYAKDVEHCDKMWPLGNHNNGELYKLYAANWKLSIELDKHKSVIEQLKRAGLKKQAAHPMG